MTTDKENTQIRTPEEVAALVAAVSDDLVRYALCMVGEINAAEEIALKAIADFVYRNAYRRLSKGYLWRVAYARSVDYLRKKRHETPFEGVADALTAPETAEESAEAAERRRVLLRALSSIPIDYRHAVYLCYLKGFSPEETARIMGKTVKQTYNLLSRGKVALKEWLEKEGYKYEDL
ncbi:MAG: RNA polymerase sigma factor [Clostridia bacterium]|nr:RNA polymerase sigma factor [Clostridia bacterium]